MFRLFNKIVYRNIRFKGPRSARIEKNPNQIYQNIDYPTKKDQNKLQLQQNQLLESQYKAGFTAQEMRNQPQFIKNIFTLKNCTPAEIKKYKMQKAVEKYQKHPNDIGSTAVQGNPQQTVSQLSQRIMSIIRHLQKHRHDAKTIVSMQKLLVRRRKLIRYLKYHDPQYWNWVSYDYGIKQQIGPAHDAGLHDFFKLKKQNKIEKIKVNKYKHD